MSIKVTFEFETPVDAVAFLQSVDAPTGDEEPKPAKRTRGPNKAPAADPTPAASAAPAAPAAAAVTAAPAPAASQAVPIKDVVDAVLAYAEIDMPKAKAILAKYGVTQVTQLKPEQYGAVLAEVKAAMVPTPAAATSLI